MKILLKLVIIATCCFGALLSAQTIGVSQAVPPTEIMYEAVQQNPVTNTINTPNESQEASGGTSDIKEETTETPPMENVNTPSETLPPVTTIPEYIEEEYTPQEPTIQQETNPVQHFHSYTASVVNATCTETGYTQYYCECGDTYIAEYTEAHGHRYGEWHSVSAATFWESGTEQRKCMSCACTESRNVGVKTISNDKCITLPDRGDIYAHMVYPQEVDFGKYYENAITLYEALLTNSDDEVHLFFAAPTYSEEYDEWLQFQRVFNEKVLQNTNSVVKRTFATGAFKEGAGLTRITIVPSDTTKLYEVCNNAIHEMNLSANTTQLEAVKIINEWMRQHFVYEKGYAEPIACLNTGKAQCAGYARVFLALCKYIGIEARYITGCAGGHAEPCAIACHAWNQVRLGDTWYYIDVCWNDASTPNRYFLTKELWEGRTVKTIENSL